MRQVAEVGLLGKTLMLDYRELLMRDEWKTKRSEILARDDHRCLQCKRADRTLQVHHCRYVLGRQPWDYPNTALMTLCIDCHQGLHKSSRPYVLGRNGGRISDVPSCKRCSGKGYIVKYPHIEHGVCFRCWGSGIAFDEIAEPKVSVPQSKYLR